MPFHGQEAAIFVDGDPLQVPVGDIATDGELILVFTNAAAANTLRSTLPLSMRVLIVGGGGAGGYGTTGSNKPGGGGGGGEVIELENKGYQPGTYQMIIGAGGVQTTAASNGENGHPSSFTADGETHTALGGGGGGCEGEGNGTNKVGMVVATGGGGSNSKVGGLGTVSNGGKAANTSSSGGGGGASTNGTASSGSKGGAGGAGKTSTIWLNDDESPRAFGGGGGGGQSGTTASNDGLGADGGGRGGRRNNGSEDGKPNTGGGGGGGGRADATHSSQAFIGGAGGSGVVIIRITTIEVPLTWIPISVSAGGNDGTIFVDSNASWTRVNPSDLSSDLIITYSNTTMRGGLCFYDPKGRPEYASLPPVWAKARVLAVGGGGGGGFVTERKGGGGGGGGAGGYVEEDGLVFDNSAEFSIEVGKGGNPGAENAKPGDPGKDSALTTNGFPVIARAIGGGGGGALSNGGSGGSGGGGSMIGVGAPGIGGNGTDEQGHRGGDEDSKTGYAGAGGGGAGSDGGNPSSSGGGNGGIGKECDISGTTVWYAGGGGGAYLNDVQAGSVFHPGGSGGSGVGGVGAGIENGELVAAGNGMDGRGGGGGGGTSQAGATSPAGKGGSGVVIIRLSGFVVTSVPFPKAVDEQPFTYDGKAHQGVKEFYAYSLTNGTLVATNADVYTVRPYLDPSRPFTWEDGSKGYGKTITWYIKQLVVDAPTWGTAEKRLNYFTFGNAKTGSLLDEEEKLAIDSDKWLLKKNRAGYPGETCAVTNDAGTELPYCTLTGHRETNAGSYQFTATLVTTDPQGNFATNFVWRTPQSGKGPMDTWSREWTIQQATNEITSLALADWQEGTTNKVPTSEWTWRKVMEKHADHYPHPDVVTYQWRPEGADEWDDDPKPVDDVKWPTEAGAYELRAYICKDSNHAVGNWGEAEKTVRFCVWRHPSKTLADWMELTFSWSSSRYITVNLRDVERNATGAVNTGYPGFSYADVLGEGDLAEIRFVAISNLTDVAACDKDNPLAADELLPFKAQTWNRSGVSEIRVKMPPKSVSKIRMYWRRRPGVLVFLADKLASEVTASSGNLVSAYGLVNQLQRIEDGADVRAWVNYWTTEPSVTRYVKLNELKASDVKQGAMKNGTVVTTYRMMPQKQVVDFNYVKTNAGPYAVNFSLKELETGTASYPGPHVYFDGDRTWDLEVYEDRPQPIDPSGPEGATCSGRVLTANDDTNTAHAVALQSYWRVSTDEPPSPNPYWEHGGAPVPEELSGLNLRPFANHTLRFVSEDGAETNVLWDLTNVFIGNMMTNDAAASGDNVVLSNRWNTLPWSTTSVAISAPDAPFDHTEVGQLVMRNIWDAEIRSGVFTNGVGTLYFDAVNALARSPVKGDYQLVVEYAPAGSGTWTPVTLLPLSVSGTSVTKGAATEVLSCLGVGNGGKVSSFVFYRVCAKIDRREPTRVRIRRVSVRGEGEAYDSDDPDGFIVIDNVIASWPTPSARLESPGTYDPEKRGKCALGMEKAFSVDYPTPYETDLTMTAEYTGALAVTNIQSARCHYRWRYLNTRFEPDRRIQSGRTNDIYEVVYLDTSTFRMNEPFRLNGHAGDIEYWFDLTAIIPYYRYVDYSGRDLGLKDCYTEEPSPGVESHFEAPDVLPSGGREWFVRLREGRDPYGGVTLKMTDGPLAGNYPMYLAEDNTWKCHVLVPERRGGVDVKGTCGFYFKIEDTGAAFHPADEKVELPAKGLLASGEKPSTFTIDHAATCLEFRFNDRYSSYAALRAEYQTFDEWNDAHSPLTKPDFFASGVDTNGVNLVKMETYPAPIADWPPYVATNTLWAETFYLPGYDEDYGYPRDEIFPSHATPNDWSGEYIAFVQEALGGSLTHKSGTGSDYHPYPLNSGMAGKLLGKGKGKLTFQLENPRPNGLERITFRAHLGQSLEEEHFAYSQRSLWNMNYMFTTLATLSHGVDKDSKTEANMAADASLSMIAFYQPGVGFYEFRIERIETGAMTMMSLWKWQYVNGALTPVCLCKRRMGVAMWTNDDSTVLKDSNTVGTAGDKNPKYRLMFISAEYTGTSTRIYGGISADAQLPYTGATAESNFNKMGNGYCGLYYNDKSTPFMYGAYGLAAKDCPAEFLRPKHFDCLPAPITSGTAGITLTGRKDTDYEFLVGRTDANAQYFAAGNNKSHDIGWALGSASEDWGEISNTNALKDVIKSYWTLPPKRIEPFVNGWKPTMAETHHGLRVPTDLSQKVIVELQDAGKKGDWFGVATNTVRGYSFQPVSVPLYVKGKYNMRLTTDADAVDVVVDDVNQAQWMGESGADGAAKFVYTQGHVVTNTAKGRVEVELVPARAKADKALSIRSPIIDGLGKITFAYANADANTEIWVQMATNDVDATTLPDYNDSVRSVEKGCQQQIGEWITLAKYSSAGGGDPELRLGEEGWKTVYVGLHDNKDNPIRGVFRLFVPTNVVAYTDTRTSRELDLGDRDHGKVSITELWVSDEPGLDARSWRGWNLRTIGDDQDSEKRMYLADLLTEKGGYGLVCALNNSLNDAVDKDTGLPDDEKTRTCSPTIWSPTLGRFTNEQGAVTQAGVGELTFKARLYGDDVKIAPAKVTLWGSEVGSLAEKWDRVAEFEISSPYFTNVNWKAGDKSYTALRLEVSDPSARTIIPLQDRVILDEIAISERVAPTLSFVYAWPFRSGLDGTEPIADIGVREQQPLCGENWGVQTQLRLQQLGDEVDLSRGLEVSVAYTDVKPSAADWGYENWLDRAKGEVRLVPVGDPSNLVFRSVRDVPESVLPPSAEAGTVVQFMLTVKYWDKGGAAYGSRLSSWTQPAWYHPVDYNKQYPGFAAYTILDRISPGRAWINELNWNNGSRSLTHTDERVVDNQFMEVCVPSGMDMSGWKVRAYDRNGDFYDIATFGTLRVNSSKTSDWARNNGYEFFVLMSPATQAAGKLRDEKGGLVEADGTWSMTSALAGMDNGTFSYSQPYAFELIRPSGVIEHTFTIDGTNDWGTVRYDATNLLAVLNEMDHSPSRFYAGRELEKNDNGGKYAPRGTTFGSSGVVRDQGGPGSEGTWVHGLDFTVGSLNPGQVIPEGWFLPPNGTNSWVYFTVVGDHLAQRVGAETGRSVLVILPQGVSTSVTYTANAWWETASVTVNGRQPPLAEHRPGNWTMDFKVPEDIDSMMVNVVATEGVDSRLDDDRFKLKGQRYRNAVLNWLQEKYPDKDPDDIRFARMAQLKTPEATHEMTLIDMYWLDICPFNTETDPKEANPFEAMDPPKSEWVLRAGFTDYAPNAVKRVRSGEEILNSVFKVKMYITNEFTHAAYAPYTLQGIGNERSCDGNWSGNNWTSETFKINGFLDVNGDGGFNRGFLPFREFVFHSGSFAPATAGEGTRTEGGVPGEPGAFETVIELIDPFSGLSTPGVTYGWWRWPRSKSAYFNWRITHTNASPMSVEYLMPKSTYDR